MRRSGVVIVAGIVLAVIGAGAATANIMIVRDRPGEIQSIEPVFATPGPTTPTPDPSIEPTTAPTPDPIPPAPPQDVDDDDDDPDDDDPDNDDPDNSEPDNG